MAHIGRALTLITAGATLLTGCSLSTSDGASPEPTRSAAAQSAAGSTCAYLLDETSEGSNSTARTNLAAGVLRYNDNTDLLHDAAELYDEATRREERYGAKLAIRAACDRMSASPTLTTEQTIMVISCGYALAAGYAPEGDLTTAGLRFARASGSASAATSLRGIRFAELTMSLSKDLLGDEHVETTSDDIATIVSTCSDVTSEVGSIANP